MSEKTPVAAAYPRLSLAYFLQFAIWGSYGFALTGYVANALNFPGNHVGWIGAAIPIGAILAPMLVAPLADRYFAAQKVLAFLHLLAGILLCFAGTQTTFMPMLLAMIAVGMCYMPTMALMNSIVFEHVPNRDNAPRVFMFGTMGWIAVVLFIQAFFGGGATNQFFYVAAGCCFLLAVYALTLPNTPPKGAADGDVMGLKAFSLFKKPAFFVFVLAILLAGIPACGLFFTLCVPMLMQNGYPAPLALTTINQFSEVFFMFLLPILATRFGLKNVLLIGIAAWFLRYFCFMEPVFALALVGLALHGLAYAFFYVASYMYGDKVASDDMKASVQGLIATLVLGVGQVCGSVLAGNLMAAYPAQMTTFTYEAPAAVEETAAPAEAAPALEETAAPAEAAPAVEEAAAPVEAAPAVEEAAAPVEAAPAVEETAAPVEAAPAVEETAAPVEAAPAVEEAAAPAEAAPAVEEAAAPAEALPAELPNPTTSTTAVEEAAPAEAAAPAVEETAAPQTVFALPAWTDPALADSAWQNLDLSRLVTKQDPNAPKAADLNQIAKEGVLTLADIPAEGMQFGETLYTQAMLQEMLRQVYAAVNPEAKDVADADIKVTLADYQKIQCNDWAKIYRIPLFMLGTAFVIFLLFGKRPEDIQ